LNALWHSRLPIYDTGFCLNSLVSYGALFQNRYYAIAIWTNPVAPNLPQHEWLELRRMAISFDAPKNTASRMLSVMAKLIKVKFPQVERLISYQDKEVHRGTIYKASNWIIGAHHGGGSWNRPNSRNKSTGLPRTRPDLNKAIGAKTRWEYRLVKEGVMTKEQYKKRLLEKIYIPIEDVMIMQAIRDRINKPDLLDIVWTKKGKPLEIPQKIIEDFHLTGLNNCDFITSNYYQSQRGYRV